MPCVRPRPATTRAAHNPAGSGGAPGGHSLVSVVSRWSGRAIVPACIPVCGKASFWYRARQSFHVDRQRDCNGSTIPVREQMSLHYRWAPESPLPRSPLWWRPSETRFAPGRCCVCSALSAAFAALHRPLVARSYRYQHGLAANVMTCV